MFGLGLTRQEGSRTRPLVHHDVHEVLQVFEVPVCENACRAGVAALTVNVAREATAPRAGGGLVLIMSAHHFALGHRALVCCYWNICTYFCRYFCQQTAAAVTSLHMYVDLESKLSTRAKLKLT